MPYPSQGPTAAGIPGLMGGRTFDQWMESMQPRYGSRSGLWAAENGRNIGNVAGYLSGVPGLGTLGGMIGQNYIQNHVFQSPVNPNDPSGQQAALAAQREAFPSLQPQGPAPQSSPAPSAAAAQSRYNHYFGSGPFGISAGQSRRRARSDNQSS